MGRHIPPTYFFGKGKEGKEERGEDSSDSHPPPLISEREVSPPLSSLPTKKK